VLSGNAKIKKVLLSYTTKKIPIFELRYLEDRQVEGYENSGFHFVLLRD
jgi:hypothetical protein